MVVSKNFVEWLSYWEGDKVLKKDLRPAEKEVRGNVPEEWRTERRHFETMVALAYTRGGASFLTSNTPLALAMRKHYSEPNERAVGTGILLSKSGSVLRRNAERELFLNGNYHTTDA
jgi:GH24 family phage-related lysozyme (muramidase)